MLNTDQIVERMRSNRLGPQVLPRRVRRRPPTVGSAAVAEPARRAGAVSSRWLRPRDPASEDPSRTVRAVKGAYGVTT